ncbi:glycosyltransferase family 2 protein [Novosphingobium rosa]|uniref:glycosyltransferase family 2 protein n=1 Tax=Novosphingobium rosa TaxID=76978 RepID=UPI000834ABD7|nr:glycosyltransferase family 2 protein [Novosphingobium rosa]
MSDTITSSQTDEAIPATQPDVSIIMPCLNEIESLPHCLANAREAAQAIHAKYGLTSEILIADNGSTDGSQAYAQSQGARVVPVARRGYGAALIGGCEGGHGRYLLMADADGSYNFLDGVAMIGRLVAGADLCMGSRFAGGIAKGAMPWKNRYIGNPILTGVLNLFFRAGIDDAHCGIRAITKQAFLACGLSSTGMEFASEMVIKSTLLGQRIEQVPATLGPDLRDRAPHLRPWRDGWRHLRYLLMLSPTWVFGVPALLALLAGLVLMGGAGTEFFRPNTLPQIGSYWTLLGGALVAMGHLALLMAVATHLYSIRQGYRRATWVTGMVNGVASLESMLLAGLGLMALGALALALVAYGWVAREYQAASSLWPAAMGVMLVQLGLQNALGGFLMAIMAGHEARFFTGLK